ncbi:hypothetical protein EAF07_03425 [Streptococcus hillyeri]|uniref:Uncharacterized protein n=1 Tax=Streptococcus hillyeri TaxID=2282420 RepID=A0A3L9DUV4_9STRE|nr:hypothetical protein EAF07_03425 [Streptococcus hillyeri]
MRFKFTKSCFRKIIVLMVRAALLSILTWLLLKRVSENFSHIIDFRTFFENELLSLLTYDEFGRSQLDISKMLTTSSIFLVGCLSSLMFVWELLNSYRALILYKSQSYICFTQKRILLVALFYLQDLMVWLVGLLPLYFYFKNTEFFILLGRLMLIYLIFITLIALISNNSTIAFLLFFVLLIFQKLIISSALISCLGGAVLIVILGSGILEKYLEKDGM